MTAILGYSELLSSPEFSSEERREFLDTIRRNGEALLQLINDILDLSRIEADKLPVSKMQVPLYPILEDVVSSRCTAGHKTRD